MARKRRRRWTRAKRKRAQARAKRTLRRRRRLEAQARAQGTSQYGFLLPLGAQLRELHLRERIVATVSLRKHPGATFQAEDVIVGLLGLQLAGFRRTDHLPCLAKEVALANQLGLPRWFGETTARDFLELAEDQHIAQMRSLVRDLSYERARPGFGGFLHVLGDSSLLPSWPSRREGVRPGAGSKTKVELCRKVSLVSVEDLPCDFALHAGNRNPVEYGEIALEHALALGRLHPDWPILLALDSGYDSQPFVDRLMDEARSHRNFHFVQAVSAVPNSHAARLAAEAESLPRDRWIPINRRTSICDLTTRKPYSDSERYPRVIVARRLVQKYRGPRGRRYLVTQFEYELLVTDLTPQEASARKVFAHYHCRQGIEASIKDSKQSLPLLALPSRHFRANHFFLGIVTLAHLVHALYRRTLWPRVRAWGKTLVRDLYRLPGRVITTARFLLDPPYRCWRATLIAARLALEKLDVRIDFQSVWTEPGHSR